MNSLFTPSKTPSFVLSVGLFLTRDSGGASDLWSGCILSRSCFIFPLQSSLPLEHPSTRCFFPPHERINQIFLSLSLFFLFSPSPPVVIDTRLPSSRIRNRQVGKPVRRNLSSIFFTMFRHSATNIWKRKRKFELQISPEERMIVPSSEMRRKCFALAGKTHFPTSFLGWGCLRKFEAHEFFTRRFARSRYDGKQGYTEIKRSSLALINYDTCSSTSYDIYIVGMDYYLFLGPFVKNPVNKKLDGRISRTFSYELQYHVIWNR